MGTSLPRNFSIITEELCNLLYVKAYDRERINLLIDELNANPFKSELFVKKQDAVTIITALCLNIKPTDDVLAAKTSHLLNSILTKQNLQYDLDYIQKATYWHIQCLKICSDMVVPDIMHNIQCIIQINPAAGQKFAEELIGSQGVLNKFLDTQQCSLSATQNQLHLCLSALKCMCSVTSVPDEVKSDQASLSLELKEQVSQLVVDFLLKISKAQNEYQYCKVVITALRVLAQIYFNDQNINIPLPELMGISRYFLVYGLVVQGLKPEKIMPAQQTIAAVPSVTNRNPKGGKKQKIRKQRNNAIETLKKEIPVSDRSLMKEVDSFENHSIYKPVSQNYLEPQKERNYWVLTSDSDASDVESSREAKLVALKSRVRQSASNLLLVLIKVTEKRDMFGYWWALLPDAPEVDHWHATDSAKKTLAYCAVTDPTSNNRASVLSVVLALLSGSRMYLSQAEVSKKENASFIPFSESLGYIINCMHKVLTGILDGERSHAVILVALKCCAALVQATPYSKMKDGLISELVRSSRKFLVHKDVTLQVGALITMGCVLSVDPKVDEIIKAIEKDTAPSKLSNQVNKENDTNVDECDDFEEGYSDDEMFTAVEQKCIEKTSENRNRYEFKSWILDICFKNMGWTFKDNEVIKCKPSAIPVILESLQVLSALAFHHLPDVLQPHLSLLADVLFEMLQHEHQDVTLQAAKTVSIIGDAIQKLEQTNESPPVNQCVYMWQKLLTPLSTVLQCHDNPQCKAVVCDCIANIGERSFKELPRHLQVLCCTLLVGSCSDEEAAVRAAAVRALAMTVMFRTLREDIGFVSDCGENILRALAEPSLVVRTKAAWALGNLSDALVLNVDDPEIDVIDDLLLQRLLEVSIQCANDNDKVKMSAMRGLGNILRLIKQDNLQRDPQIKTLCETAIAKLLDCACKVSNMKVRWNACYAMGNAMKNEDLFTCFSGWQVFKIKCGGMICMRLRTHRRALRHSCASTYKPGWSMNPFWEDEVQLSDASRTLDDSSSSVQPQPSTSKKSTEKKPAKKRAPKKPKAPTTSSSKEPSPLDSYSESEDEQIPCAQAPSVKRKRPAQMLESESQVFPNLCTLTRDCKNLKVRINAAVALRAPSSRTQYGEHFAPVWRGIMEAMENAANVDDFTEYRHKDNLIEQLSVTLAHLCCLLKQPDLSDILDPLVFHYECAASLLRQLCHKLPPENASCLRILEAAKYVTVDLTAAGDTQSQSLAMLQEIFIWDM